MSYTTRRLLIGIGALLVGAGVGVALAADTYEEMIAAGALVTGGGAYWWIEGILAS